MGALPDPASDLGDYLNGLAVSAAGVTLALGTNLFKGPTRMFKRSPATTAVFIMNTGGPAPEPYLNGGRKSWARPTVQVVIRGATSDFANGEIVARAVYEALHQQSIGSYTAIFARDSQPVMVGLDENDQANWVINLECQGVLDLP